MLTSSACAQSITGPSDVRAGTAGPQRGRRKARARSHEPARSARSLVGSRTSDPGRSRKDLSRLRLRNCPATWTSIHRCARRSGVAPTVSKGQAIGLARSRFPTSTGLADFVQYYYQRSRGDAGSLNAGSDLGGLSHCLERYEGEGEHTRPAGLDARDGRAQLAYPRLETVL